MYFVTICTKNRENFFGKIFRTDSEIELIPTEIGKIAHSEWHKTIKLRPDMNLELGEFVVMPNHIHGIIIIGTNEFNSPLKTSLDEDIAETRLGDTTPVGDATAAGDANATAAGDANATAAGDANATTAGDARHRVSTEKTNEYKNRFAPQSKNLSSIIRGYKSAVTMFARKNKIEFDWQSRFHEHVIRSSEDYDRISNYIIENPAKWQNDKFYKQ